MKNKHLNIEGINPAKTVFLALTRKTTFKSAWRLFFSAMTEFFLPQFQTSFGLSKRKVVTVAHPLDDTLPFRPELVHIYLHFYPLWIKCMYFLYKEFGKASLPHIARFMRMISDAYYQAGKIYRVCQSTTDRPKYYKTAKFKLIHLVDPHLHCIPSLHVFLVLLIYNSIPGIIDELSGLKGGYSEQKAYLYRQAVEITDSVLLIKQHSVNCIPATLFLFSQLYPEYVDADCESFVNDLLADPALETAGEVRNYILERYRHYMGISAGRPATEIVLGFLMSCETVKNA